MTRCFVLAATVAVAWLSVVSGCGAGSTPDSTTSPPTPRSTSASATATTAPTTAAAPFAPTYADLVRALPTAADLPGWKVDTRCVRATAACAQAPGRDDGRGAFVSAMGEQRGRLSEQVQVSVIHWPSATAARRFADPGCSQAENDYTGAFDRGLVDRGDDTFRPGEEGIGTFTHTDRGPWRGCRASARLRYYLDDSISPPSEHTYYLLVRNRYGVLVSVDRWADRTADSRSGPTARRELGDVLARLDVTASG